MDVITVSHEHYSRLPKLRKKYGIYFTVSQYGIQIFGYDLERIKTCLSGCPTRDSQSEPSSRSESEGDSSTISLS